MSGRVSPFRPLQRGWGATRGVVLTFSRRPSLGETGISGIRLALPLIAAGVYLSLLASRIGAVLDALTWNSDYASPMVIAETLRGGARGGRVFVNQVSYVWVDLATGWLPYHRHIWEWWPYGLGVAGVAVLAWVALQLVGPGAAALVFCLGLAASPTILASQLAQALHGITWFNSALLLGFLIWAGSEVGDRSRYTRWAFAAGVALATGLNLDSDLLLAVAGLVPLLTAVLVVWLRRRNAWAQHLLLLVGGTSAGATVVAIAFHFVLRAGGFSSTVPRGLITLASPRVVLENMRLLGAGILDAWNGALVPQPGAGGALALLCAVLAVFAAVLPVAALLEAWRAPTGSRADSLLLAVFVFWTVSEALVAAGFLLTRQAAELGSESSRYLVGFFYAGVLTLALWARASGLRALVVGLGGTAFVVASSAALLRATHNDTFRQGNTRELPTLMAHLEEQGLVRGYASYRDSPGMTWKGAGRLRVYPVSQQPVTPDERCGMAQESICPFTLNVATAWYLPQPATGTFVVLDPGVAYVTAAPPPSLGVPTSIDHVGRFTVFVYADDVAARMGTPPKFFRPPRL